MQERRVSLFREGQGQAVRIPREFELPGEEAILRSENGKLTLEPVKPSSPLAYLERMEPVDDDWPEKFEQSVERLRAEGRQPIEEPAKTGGLLALLATLEPIDEDWPEIDDSPPEPVEL